MIEEALKALEDKINILYAGLLSKEHFNMDGTLIEVLASLRRNCPKDEDDSRPPQVANAIPL